MADPAPPEDASPPKPVAIPAASRWAKPWEQLKRFRGPIAAIAAFGAVLSGLLGYWHAYETVETVVASKSASVAVRADAGPLAIATPSLPAPSVAVVPLSAPAGDADASRFGEALTRYLLTNLPIKAEYGRVLVVSGGPTANGGAGAIDARDLGRKLNVRYVLEGDVVRSGDLNAVNLRLIDAATRVQVWSGRETLRDADVASESSAPLSGVHRSVRNALLGAEEQRVKAQSVSALNAPNSCCARSLWEGEDPSLAGLRGAETVDEALRLEPDFVPALVLRAALFHDEGEADPNARTTIASPASRTDTRRGPCSTT